MTISMPWMRSSCWGEGSPGTSPRSLALSEARLSLLSANSLALSTVGASVLPVRNAVNYNLVFKNKIQVVFAILLVTKDVLP